jgi:hypothetical protein
MVASWLSFNGDWIQRLSTSYHKVTSLTSFVLAPPFACQAGALPLNTQSL